MTRLIALILAIGLHIMDAAGKDPVDMHWSSLGHDVEAFDSMMERAAFMDVPRRYLTRIVANFTRSDNPAGSRQAEARRHYWCGWVLMHENPDSAKTLSKLALELCDSAAYPYDHARFSLLNADLLRQYGNLAEAYFIYRDKLKTLQKVGDKFWEAKTLVGIGAIMQELGELHEALRNYSEAQEIFEIATSMTCMTKNRINLANVNYMLGDKEKGLDYLNGLETDRYVANDSSYLVNVLVSRFHISDFSDTSAAVLAYEIGEKLDNERLSVLTNLVMGRLSHNNGNNLDAIAYLKRAYGKAERISDFNNQKKALEGLEEYYTVLKMTDSAEICHSHLVEINDSVYALEKMENLRRTEHLVTITRYEQRMAQEAESHHWRQTLTISIAGLMLVILSLSLCLLWSARKKAETSRRLQEEKNKHLALLNSQYSHEIEAKEKELASNTVLLAQKNAKLKQLAEKIKGMERNGDLRSEESEAINKTINSELNADDDWRFFKLRFEKVHPAFFESLQQAYPTLSRTELKLCAYIKVGMSAKEIAQILSVIPPSINTSRYRIRKKMRLGPDESLEAALDKF